VGSSTTFGHLLHPVSTAARAPDPNMLEGPRQRREIHSLTARFTTPQPTWPRHWRHCLMQQSAVTATSKHDCVFCSFLLAYSRSPAPACYDPRNNTLPRLLTFLPALAITVRSTRAAAGTFRTSRPQGSTESVFTGGSVAHNGAPRHASGGEDDAPFPTGVKKRATRIGLMHRTSIPPCSALPP
jgi:hypothetical protein